MSESVNTKHEQVRYAVPRDPDAYRATVHFGQRLKDRVPEYKRDAVVRECIQRGDLFGTRPTVDCEEDEVKQYFAFQATVYDQAWRLIVGIRPAAFKRPDTPHLAVTIMEVDDD